MSDKLKVMAAVAVMGHDSSVDIPVGELKWNETATTNIEPATTNITEQMIAERAYSLWRARNGEGGSPEDDWYRAIEELTAESRR